MVGEPIRLAVTVGDPRGIGPEVLRAAVDDFRGDQRDSQILVLGDEESLSRLPERCRRRSLGTFTGGLESAGALSLHAIREGVALALRGEVDALVTGPVHKPALRAAGIDHPGQTELLQALTDSRQVGMLMHAESTRASGPLRVLLATTHHPLREVPSLLTTERIVDQTRLLASHLMEGWGIAEPRIALCALNPHASDGGLFGDEEARILQPAVESLRRAGIRVTGPHPADTVFLRVVDGLSDAVVVPYHDVGMAVFKTLAFGRGVNTTLGLPFPRTSPDHGTAFDRVGTGTADPTSFLEALRLAARLGSRRAAAFADGTGRP